MSDWYGQDIIFELNIWPCLVTMLETTSWVAVLFYRCHGTLPTGNIITDLCIHTRISLSWLSHTVKAPSGCYLKTIGWNQQISYIIMASFLLFIDIFLIKLFVHTNKKDRKRPVDHEEQQNFDSSICFTSSPMNHDPVLTSSWAYVRRRDL